jgi:hypothetical protein
MEKGKYGSAPPPVAPNRLHDVFELRNGFGEVGQRGVCVTLGSGQIRRRGRVARQSRETGK